MAGGACGNRPQLCLGDEASFETFGLRRSDVAWAGRSAHFSLERESHLFLSAEGAGTATWSWKARRRPESGAGPQLLTSRLRSLLASIQKLWMLMDWLDISGICSSVLALGSWTQLDVWLAVPVPTDPSFVWEMRHVSEPSASD